MNTFNLSWNETLKLNYRTFTHRCRYVIHKNAEANKAAKAARAEAKRKAGRA